MGEYTAIITSQDPRDNQGRGLAAVKKEGVMKVILIFSYNEINVLNTSS